MIKYLRKNLNNSGSSLVWVAVSMVVLLILIGGILTMASVYHGSAVNSNARNQAYYSARSGVDGVGAELQANPTGELATTVAGLEVGKTLSLGEVSFGDNADMGTCTLTLYKTEDKIVYVKADATVGDVTDTVVALLGKQEIANSTGPGIPDYFYLGAAGNEENELTFAEMDNLYFDEGNARITIQGTDNVAPKITKNIYSKRPLVLAGYRTQAGRISVSGNVVSSKDVSLQGYVVIGGDLISQTNVNLRNRNSANIRVAGTIKSANVTIEQNLAITANGVEATAFTLNSGSSFTGTVSANTLTLENGATITGNVQCDTLVINGISTTVPAVRGNVSARSIQIGNMVYATLEQLTAAYPQTATDITPTPSVLLNQIFTGTVTYTQAYQVPTLTLDIPTAATPGFGSASDLEAAMISPFVSSGGNNNYVLGTEDGNDSFYVLDGDDKKNKQEIKNADLTIQGSGNIFLYLINDAELEINRITYKDSFNKTAPTFYIVAKGKSDLEFEKTVSEFYGYIYAQKGDNDDDDLPDLEVKSKGDRNLTIYGGLYMDGLDDDKDFIYEGLTVKTIPSAGFGSAGGGTAGGGTTREQWYVRQYLNSLPGDLEG